MAELRAKVCPGCGSPPHMAFYRQYFCGNDDCRVLVWDPTEDPAKFKATAREVDLGFLDDEGEA